MYRTLSNKLYYYRRIRYSNYSITSKSSVDDLDSDSDEPPALGADVCLLTARPNVIVVCHIDIKDKLFTPSLEVSLLDSIFHARLGEERERGGRKEERERGGGEEKRERERMEWGGGGWRREKDSEFRATQR